MTVATRRYEQRLRAQTAEETRHRVLDAVYEAAARGAGAAGQRGLDRAYRGRRAVDGLRDLRLARGALRRVHRADLLERGGFRRVLDAIADPDPRVHLRDGITGGVHTFAAHRDVFRALVSMAALDPDAVGGAMQRSEQRRAKGMMRLARRLARHGLLREGLAAKAAADRLWVTTSFDAFDLLCTPGAGCRPTRSARTLVDTAERSVLATVVESTSR